MPAGRIVARCPLKKHIELLKSFRFRTWQIEFIIRLVECNRALKAEKLRFSGGSGVLRFRIIPGLRFLSRSCSVKSATAVEERIERSREPVRLQLERPLPEVRAGTQRSERVLGSAPIRNKDNRAEVIELRSSLADLGEFQYLFISQVRNDRAGTRGGSARI